MNFGDSVSRGFNPGAVLSCIHFRVSVAHVIQARGAAPHVVAVVHSLNSMILTVDHSGSSPQHVYISSLIVHIIDIRADSPAERCTSTTLHPAASP